MIEINIFTFLLPYSFLFIIVDSIVVFFILKMFIKRPKKLFRSSLFVSFGVYLTKTTLLFILFFRIKDLYSNPFTIYLTQAN